MAASDPVLSADVLEAVQLLVRTPSVNPSIAPDEAHGESAVAAAACEWLERHGVRAWLEEAAPGRPNAVAEIDGGSGPSIVFCAHLDTVATEGMTIPPFEPRIDGDRLYGRGSYDMKGSGGAIMAAAAALARKPPKGRVLLALVADEEYASIGAMDFVKRHRADGCIVTEPSEGKLILGHKGFVWIEVETRGKAAHGSRWDLGVSAIGKMARIVAALEEFDRHELRSRVHALVGPASMHCALINGGTGLSTYAPECRLKIERRTLPGETADQVKGEIARVVHAAGEDATVSVFFDRPPLTCDPQDAIVSCVREAVATVTNQTPVDAGVAYWMDAAVFAEAGIPTVNYGPSGAGAHEAVEWVNMPSVVTVAEVLVESARRFLSDHE